MRVESNETKFRQLSPEEIAQVAGGTDYTCPAGSHPVLTGSDTAHLQWKCIKNT